ncbi:LamG domain-containing protein [Micromonospora sp. SL1-18]|uniref:LamG domain-containing protein n=1 Tax=Micromonospora sp. SL1-18 TaxID=3399128 RepID=UPI003A4D2C89
MRVRARWRAGLWRWLPGWVAVVVVAASGAVVVPSAGAASAAPACTGEALSEAQALAAAAGCGQPVAVGASRSEYVQVVAQPDGRLSFESAVVPQRARRSDGSWADVDLKLRSGGDGLLRPAVSVADVAFSGGGSSPLVSLRRAGQSLSLSWPGVLPVPVVAGDSATYPNVLPDVDLVVRATHTGFTHVLVVKSAQAAADPRVRTISFGVSGDAALSRRPDGSLQAVAGTKVVAEAERAVMWDSSTPAARGLQVMQSTALAAGDGVRTADVDTRVTGDGDLELVPDEGLLADPDVTYPVFVDPAWSVARSKWAYATSNGCTNTDYSMARVGLSPDGPCTGVRFRSFFEFPTTNGTVSLKGKYIYSAYVQMGLYHSWSCTNTWTHMYLTPAINATMKASWSSMSLSKWLDSAEGHANKGTGCVDSPQKDMTMNFEGSTVTGQVQTAATNSWNTITVGFCACNDLGEYESSQDRWKKFYPDKAKLVVDYDSVPGKPTGLQVAGVACPASGVLTVGTLTPTFSAVYPDADSGQTLTGAYEWVEVPSGGIGTVTDTYPTRLAPPPRPSATANGRATTAAVSVVKGKTYAFRVTAVDPDPYKRWSGWSVWCQFTVDTTVPPVTVTVVTPPAGPGQAGTFLIKSTATDVTSFKYGWNGPTTVVAATGTSPKTATVTTTAPRYGTNILYVSAVDATLNQGFGSVEFVVDHPSPPVAWWGLESYPGQTQAQALADKQSALGSGTLAKDTPLTAQNVAWSKDARLIGGETATMVGSGSQAETSGPVVNTSTSFSVAAWVRATATDPACCKSVVSQDGVTTNAFSLYYVPSTQQWGFSMYNTDGTSTAGSFVFAPATPDVWTHLAAAYDSKSNEMRLYVNGTLAGSAARTPTWNGTGKFHVGWAKWGNGMSNTGVGQIADVQVFDRVLVDHDFTGQLASDPSSGGVDEPGILAPIEVGRWDFESARPCYFQDREGTCEAADVTPFGRWLALTRGAAVEAGNRGNGLHLDGYYFPDENPEPWEATQEWARSAVKTGLTPPDEDGDQYTIWQDQPVLRTDQSFTMSAWVTLDSLTGTRAVLSQRGVHESGGWLKYASSLSKWQCAVTSADVTGSATATVSSTSPAEAGVWTHVACVYDAGRSQLRLYVNGALEGTLAISFTPMASSGPLLVGRTLYRDQFVDKWAGAVDDIGVYQGAMTDAQVKVLHDAQSVDAPEI